MPQSLDRLTQRRGFDNRCPVFKAYSTKIPCKARPHHGVGCGRSIVPKMIAMMTTAVVSNNTKSREAPLADASRPISLCLPYSGIHRPISIPHRLPIAPHIRPRYIQSHLADESLPGNIPSYHAVRVIARLFMLTNWMLNQTAYASRLTMRGGVPRVLRLRTLLSRNQRLREYRVPLGLPPMLIGVAFVGVAIFAFHFIGSGPGRIDVAAAAICGVGATGFLLVGAAISGYVTEIVFDLSARSAARCVRWYGWPLVRQSTPFDHVHIIVRPVLVQPTAQAPERRFFAGVLVQDGRYTVVAIDENQEAVSCALESLAGLVGRPITVQESLLTVKWL